ncbi:MAG: hypothetical protein HOV80_12860 [Polyangiaceae bacterium]|nr:hypothetical protein [Polyangiaceae bacterium]
MLLGVAITVAACDAPEPQSLEVVSVEDLAAEPTPIAPEAPLVDLLYRTRSRIAVSSQVQNDTDAPEHLVDRRADTAWNSASGELDASIKFDVPVEARVRRVVLTVGYDKISSRGDQFTRNHRIKKLAIEKDGSPIGVFDLDPEDRRPQAIALDQAGGAFTLRVLETEPGTEARFREIVVSELEVLGTAPDSVLVPPAAPEVRVVSGSSFGAEPDALRPVFEGAPYATAEALCAKHAAAAAPEIARAKEREAGDVFIEGITPGCSADRPEKVVWTLPEPYEVRLLHGIEDLAYATRLIVRTERGWFPTNLVLDVTEPGPGCGHSEMVEPLEAALVDGAKTPTIRFDYAERAAEWMNLTTGSYEAAARYRVVCSDDGARVTCRRATTTASTEDLGFVDEGRERGAWTAVPKRWEWTRTADVAPDGSFRLGPCTAPDGDFVKCTPTAERWLARPH